MVTIITGDCREILKTLPDASVNCCITSPPYWGLRDYGYDGQIGLERTPEKYVEKMVVVFREVRRVLRDDGTLWLNLGDSYAANTKNRSVEQAIAKSALMGSTHNQCSILKQQNKITSGLKPKDLVGIPWMVAFALRADGWYLRQEIIWHKPNVMPESVRDRCTKAHEYIFLLAKSEHYYFDAAAILESQSEQERTRRIREQQTGLRTRYCLARDKEHGQVRPGRNGCARSVETRQTLAQKGTRNRRSVWLIPNVPGNGEHFAAFPPELPQTCMLAGCPEGGTVIDPFGGSGTVGKVAEEYGRNSILIELNPKYCEMAKKKTAQMGLFARPTDGGN